MAKHSYESLVREIKGRLSITGLVETYVSLKRAGRGFVGLCPFHDDKNPSFHVNDDIGVFHCFGCGAGGDIIGFVMKYKNLSFKEAVDELASKAEIKIENRPLPVSRNSGRGLSLKVNALACEYYHEMLTQSAEGKGAKSYLERRGFSDEIIREFQLGYAPRGWDKLENFLRRKKFPLEIAEKNGLVIKRNNREGYYDRFRNRIIFPIADVDSKVVGFGGRVIDGEDSPKYINSPESEIYHKRSIFFGLDKSKDFIRRTEKAIIVEGYMDYLSLYAAGIKNVVATLGTSLTQEHSLLLRRYTDKVAIVFDGDKSGEDASIRGLEVFLKVGITPSIVVLPQEHDPDSFTTKSGGDEFLSLVDNATSLMDFFIEKSLWSFKEGNVTRNKAIQRIIEMIGIMQDSIEKTHYIKKTAEIFGLREHELFSFMKNVTHSQILESSSLVERPNSHEKMLLKIVLKFPQLLQVLRDTSIIQFLGDSEIESVLRVMLERDLIEVSSVLLHFNNTYTQEIVSEAIFSSDDVTDEHTARKMIEDCIRKIRLRKLEDRMRYLRVEIEQATNTKDDVLEKQLIKEYKECRELVEHEKSIRGEMYED
ncbi:MAG TPA: DNA primase [Thermodesulfobacteriota bacterium]